MEEKHLLSSILNWGTSEYFNEKKNDKIKILNGISLLFAVFSFFIIIFLYSSATPFLVGGVLTIVCSVFCLVLNKYGFVSLSRFIIIIVPNLIGIYVHASIMQPLDSPITSILVLQMSIFSLPFAILDFSEKIEIALITLFNTVTLLTLPVLNGWFDYPIDSAVFKSDAIYYVSVPLFVLVLSGILGLLVYTNHLGHRRASKILDELKNRNAEMAEKEEQMKQFMEELRKAQEEDAKRTWASEGLSQIAFILRQAEDINTLSDTLLIKLVKYVRANQGAVFLLEKTSANQDALVMKACYAYDRKKYINATILPGEGLVGQCFLEADTIFITEVPKNHIRITSGLGDAPPRCLLIVPLKYNDQVLGILEMASFQVLQKHEIEFIEKVAENVASVISSVRINERTKQLLEQSQQQQEEMRAQEEEMRQNMEELMATQEEVYRKQKENDANLAHLNEILDNIPHPIFIKDETGKYSLINEAEAQLLGHPKSYIIGKDDSSFVANAEEWFQIKHIDKEILEKHIEIQLPEQFLHFENGEKRVLHTTKKAFTNKITGKVNILGISVEYKKDKSS